MVVIVNLLIRIIFDSVPQFTLIKTIYFRNLFFLLNACACFHDAPRNCIQKLKKYWFLFSKYITQILIFYLASVGLYVTSYFSIGYAASTVVCHDKRTDFGFMNVTVIFSGAAGMEPEMRDA